MWKKKFFHEWRNILTGRVELCLVLVSEGDNIRRKIQHDEAFIESVCGRCLEDFIEPVHCNPMMNSTTNCSVHECHSGRLGK